jgi:Bacterial Ig domain/Carbohydrate binding domain
MRLLFTFILFITAFLVGFSQQVIVYQENFNVTPTGWKFRNVSPHDWRWYATEGEALSGGLKMKLPNDSNYIVSPKIRLVAGKTYTVSFKSRVTQGTTSRKVNVGYSLSPYRSSATFFYSTQLSTNSYSEPPFVAYNPTLTVPTTGDYHILFYYEENGYTFTYFDDFLIEETFYPTVSLTSPANLANFTEGTDINLQANAADQDGSIVKVEFFSNGKKLAEDLVAPYEYLWKDVLPGNYQITLAATDN